MHSYNSYSNRKFYSKIGKAYCSVSKQFSQNVNSMKSRITPGFVESELKKVRLEQLILKKKARKTKNSSSFLTPNRETFMKAYVIFN